MLVFLVYCNLCQYHRIVLCLYVFRPPMLSQKRNPDDGDGPSDGDNPDDKRRKFRFWSVIQDAPSLQSMQQLLEPLIRKVVREEVELALRKYITRVQRNDGNDGKEICSSGSRCLQLKFVTGMSLPVFTGARIEGRDGSNLTVALVDTISGEVVDTGPQSSAKVEIVVLEGDFEGGGDNYTVEEFKNNIVREREGKKPLLTGDTFVSLKYGIGMVGEISFTDNSSWTRCRRFRLGARIIDDNVGTRVLEAKTASFVVRDHRGELYKKHHPPSLGDEVWRLQKISKDGVYHKRLSQEKIETVQDFLTQLYVQPSRLRNIFGPGMSTKMWEATIEHAQTCVLDKKIYVYKPRDLEQKSGVVFNVVGQVMGLLSDYQYVPKDKLSEVEKADAHNLVISAYEHWEEVDSIDDENSLVDGSSHPLSFLYTPSSPMEDHSYGSKYLASPKFSGFDFTPSNAYTSEIISSMGSIGNSSGLDDHALQGFDSMVVRYDQMPSSPNFANSSLICDSEPLNSSFFDVDHLQVLESDFQCSSIFESRSTLQGGSSSCGAQRRWTKVYGVLKWYFLLRFVIRRNKSVSERYKGAVQGHGKEKFDYG
ncbi:calmodulin-binding protein 60 A-like isoform X1 [Cucurbita maxima]|uniref:Calmodulin-binding protein 60 A-like isoform X1 n=1 Tax=Cucurbita maxima TaxID=3661 RepID=A0A6J1JJB8_CUCMA|nr:calmodulin-binding protein 60 A-like isoform X1 [Cucurbita maxima]